ncbi:MAG: hypothetical protein JSS66_11700 [Armatimonadetes bacterium]|nr:hypothetical protein [Armatimonadota bacterium]
MRVFFSAGEASGDAYGGEIARRLLERGVFAPERMASDVVAYMTSQNPGPESVRKAARQIQEFYYSSGGATAYARLFQSGQHGTVSPEALVDAIAQDAETGLLDPRRLLSESLFAVGGPKLREAGASLVADSSQWGAVGIIEAIRVAASVMSGYDDALRRLTKEDAGFFVPIDYGFVNVKLARRAKANGWKVLYFSPPGAWRRNKQGAHLPDVTDAIVTPFPWSADLLNQAGANAHFFGHPLKQMVAETEDAEHRDGIAVMPGSRGHEIASNLSAIKPVLDAYSGPVRIAVAANIALQDVQRLWDQLGGGEAEFRRDTHRVLKESRVGIIKSGTGTLEAALCGCPMVVVYKGNKLMEFEARLRKPKFEFVSLPNILLRRPVVPELLMWHCTPENIRAALEPLIEDGAPRQAQLEAFAELTESLGPADCFDKTVDLALELMSQRS